MKKEIKWKILKGDDSGFMLTRTSTWDWKSVGHLLRSQESLILPTKAVICDFWYWTSHTIHPGTNFHQMLVAIGANQFNGNFYIFMNLDCIDIDNLFIYQF